MIRRYVSRHGNHTIVEEHMFPVGDNTNRKRNQRVKGNTPLTHVTANEKACITRLTQILNNNFDAGDLLIGLDFDADSYKKLLQNGTDTDAIRALAEKELDNFLLRMKRTLKKIGITPKTVAVVADIDGDTGEYVRPHIHIVITGNGFTMRDKKLFCGDREMTKLWGRGRVSWKSLHDQASYGPIARYLLKQVRRIPDARKYKASRNMTKPEITERIVHRYRVLRAPEGALEIAHSELNDDTQNRCQYVMYIPRKKRKDERREE